MQDPDSVAPQPLLPDFRPPALIRHRHLQSMMTQAPWRRRRTRQLAAALLAASRTDVLDCGEGVRLQGYLSRPGPAERGLAVLIHGWEGSADSSYILSAGSGLLAAGFAVFRLNLRDHGNTQELNEGLFHSCRIDEVFNAVAEIYRRHASGGLFAVVGQSLGGNFALRIAARARGRGLPVDRVLAVCPVLRPHSTMHALDHGLWVYRRYFLRQWRRSLTRKAEIFPQLYRFGDLARFRTLTATTEFFVRNYTEFDSLDRYLHGYAITGAALESVGVPTRLIMAADDPVIPIDDLASIARPPAIEISLLPHGGHCGFVDSLRGSTWIDREIVADLTTAAQVP
jgi:predicted alpha/beta-fold hydrolase